MRFGWLATHALGLGSVISVYWKNAALYGIGRYYIEGGLMVGLDWYRLSMMVTSMQIQKTYALTYSKSGRSI